MSLYNILYGRNPRTSTILNILKITPNDIPRFRDCWSDEKGEIIILTRTGGGNRDFYENVETCRANYPEDFEGELANHPTGPWNDDLRKIPGYISDNDADFDRTYAEFHFKIQQKED